MKLLALSLSVSLCLSGAVSPSQPQCSDVQKNVCFHDDSAYKTLDNTTDTSKCCHECSSDASCGAFTLNKNSAKCFLHPLTDSHAPFKGDCDSLSLRPAPEPPKPKPAPEGAKNVMLFISDDLRPEFFEAFGQSQMHTPNFDKLGQAATVFNRAYCQQAICGPTRNSFLSGRRPQRTQSWNFLDNFREVGANWTSFPGYFKSYNYTTFGGGKTYHPGLPPNNDGALSWSQDLPYQDQPTQGGCQSPYFKGTSLVCPDGGPPERQTDHLNLVSMKEKLHYAHNKSVSDGNPFFLAYGLHRPHLPFQFPVVFPNGVNVWEDIYGNTSTIALPQHEHAPKDMPDIAFTYEVDGMITPSIFGVEYPIPGEETGCPYCGPAFPDNVTQTLRKGYYSAVTWIDYLVGDMLSELDSLGHADDTVIALIGDHGWQLGEHNIWGKHTNFELGTRVPLIIKAAGQTNGIRTNGLVESLDLYPTIASLAGLPAPPDVDGTDLSPFWKDPTTPLKTAVFSEYPRCAPPTAPWNDTTSCINTERTNFTIMGYSVRTDAYRCTSWMWWDGSILAGDFTKEPAAVELYLHDGDTEVDFDKFENENVADANPDTVKECLKLVEAQWRKQ